MKKKICIILLIAAVICAISAGCIVLFTSGEKPFKDLRAEEISSATVHLLPPNDTVTITDIDKLVKHLNDIVIYEEDNSYSEYNGQVVIFTIIKTDGTQMTIDASNPFVVIDDVGYRCKYKPCEALSSYANDLSDKSDF